MLAALALLLAVMSSPIRPTGASHTASSHHCILCNLAILDVQHSAQFAMSARLSLSMAAPLPSDFEDDLDADIEDDLNETAATASGSFDVLPTRCPERYSERASFPVALAARPLRC